MLQTKESQPLGNVMNLEGRRCLYIPCKRFFGGGMGGRRANIACLLLCNSAGAGSWCLKGRASYLSFPGQVLSWECRGGAGPGDHATFILLAGTVVHAVPLVMGKLAQHGCRGSLHEPLGADRKSLTLREFHLRKVSPFGSVMENIFRIKLDLSDDNWCQIKLLKCDGEVATWFETSGDRSGFLLTNLKSSTQ